MTNDLDKKRLRNAADSLASVVPADDVRATQERLIAAGVREDAYRHGEASLPMTILGHLMGSMVSAGATPLEAKRILLEGYGHPGCPELRMSLNAAGQLSRVRTVLCQEFERLCRPGTYPAALEVLVDSLVPFFERVLEAIPS